MRDYKLNRRRFGFQAVQIRSSIKIPFKFQWRYCINDLDLQLIYFQLKDWYKKLIKGLKDRNYWLKDQKCQFILKKSIYFDFFDQFWTISNNFDKKSIYLVIYINFFETVLTRFNRFCCDNYKSGSKFVSDFWLKSEAITKSFEI